MNDILGNPLKEPKTVEEPPHIDEIMKEILDNFDVIPVKVTRRGKTATRYLSECRPIEVAQHIGQWLTQGIYPTVAFQEKMKK